MKHTSSYDVEDKPGVLNRVASPVPAARLQHRVAHRRPHRVPGVSRMTIVVDTDDAGARRSRPTSTSSSTC